MKTQARSKHLSPAMVHKRTAYTFAASLLVAGKSLAKFQGQTLTELCNKLGTPMLGGTYATFGASLAQCHDSTACVEGWD